MQLPCHRAYLYFCKYIYINMYSYLAISRRNACISTAFAVRARRRPSFISMYITIYIYLYMQLPCHRVYLYLYLYIYIYRYSYLAISRCNACIYTHGAPQVILYIYTYTYIYIYICSYRAIVHSCIYTYNYIYIYRAVT